MSRLLTEADIRRIVREELAAIEAEGRLSGPERRGANIQSAINAINAVEAADRRAAERREGGQP